MGDARACVLWGHRHAGLWRLLHAGGEKAEAMLWVLGDASNAATSSVMELGRLGMVLLCWGKKMACRSTVYVSAGLSVYAVFRR